MIVNKYRVTTDEHGSYEEFPSTTEALTKYPDKTPVFVQEDLTAQLAEEADSLLKEQNKIEALAALDANDKIYIRHGKKGIGFNQEWRTYDSDVRDVAKGISTTMPIKPTHYPDGEPVE